MKARSVRGAEHERERLRALESYDVQGSAEHAGIDALVRLASRLCGAPIAMVGLLDETREWVVSVVGLPDVRELPRELSVCTHVIEQDDIFVVEDLARDPRFAQLPMVADGPQLRFYAGAPIVNPDGYALGAVCVVDRDPRQLDAPQLAALKDIAIAVGELLEARRSRDELQRRNELLRLAEEVSLVGHWRVDLTNERIFWSPQVYRIHGRDPAVFVPDLATAIEAYHPDDRDVVSRALGRAVASHEPFDFEARLLRTDGVSRRVHCRGRDEVDPASGESTAIFGVFQDITDRETMREMNERRDRLVTTGTLAAGIGHEINNPLTFLSANLDFALEDLAKDHEMVEVLREARQGAERIRKIVRGLRAFAREETLPISLDVPSTIESSINVAMHEIRHRATLVRHDETVPRVLADDARLSQVLVNLLTNAAHSFLDADLSRNRIHVGARVAEGGRVAIDVRDNGRGIPAEVLPRIFDPFFTTKEAGQGTGLGLSICHNIVHALGGEIVCTTEIGVGTTFSVLLTAAAADGVEPAARRTPIPGERVRGRVLLVDDEEAVLRVVARALGSEHEVVAVADSRLAEARLLGARESFDVIICDLMMPHLTGMDLYRRVLAERPEVATRFLFLSGGGAQADLTAFLAEVPNERLDKPFHTPELRDLVRSMVWSARATAC